MISTVCSDTGTLCCKLLACAIYIYNTQRFYIMEDTSLCNIHLKRRHMNKSRHKIFKTQSNRWNNKSAQTTRKYTDNDSSKHIAIVISSGFTLSLWAATLWWNFMQLILVSFRHHISILNLLFLATDHWWDINYRNEHMVRIVDKILLKKGETK